MTRPLRTTPSKKCENCGEVYLKRLTQSWKNWDERSRFCSKSCIAIHCQNGKTSRFKNGHIPWFKKQGLAAPPGGPGWNKLPKEEAKRRKNERYKKWKKKNLERLKEYRKEWHKANPEKSHEYYKRGYEKNKARYRKHKFLRRIREKCNGGHFTQKEWQELLEKWGNKCLACGSQERIVVDHVKPVSLGGMNDITNIQPLCQSCNSSKQDRYIDYRSKFKTLK